MKINVSEKKKINNGSNTGTLPVLLLNTTVSQSNESNAAKRNNKHCRLFVIRTELAVMGKKSR
jgi:hypothetical protein